MISVSSPKAVGGLDVGGPTPSPNTHRKLFPTAPILDGTLSRLPPNRYSRGFTPVHLELRVIQFPPAVRLAPGGLDKCRRGCTVGVKLPGRCRRKNCFR